MIDERDYEIMKEAHRKRAAERFATFLDYVSPTYSRQWFHTLIAEKCQALLNGTLGTNKLMLYCPPQHGKSEIVSRKFPAWALGVNPRLKIVGSSYSAELAQQFSRAIQRTIDSEEYEKVFPNTFLNGKNTRTDVTRNWLRNADMFETVGWGGFYKAVGVGGSLTGTPADLAIIDDPVKDALEAYSETYRERVWNWYTDVFLTRLHNKSKQLLIMTRWHEDDLAGRLLATERDDWSVISIPAIREDEDMKDDPRKIGEALWEEKHSVERLRDAERRSPRTFAALYQQRPAIEGGNIVKREWFKKISFSEFKSMRFNETMHFYLDTAYGAKKTHTDNDPSGILAACRIGQYIYLYDAKKVYKEMPDLLRFLPEYMATNGGDKKSILHVEPKANGLSVVQMLMELTSVNVKTTPSPTDSKEVRFRAISPRIECGRVVMVEGDWNEQFLEEVCGFPNARHDEYVDILVYAINDLYEDDSDIDYSNLSKASFGLM